MPRRLVAAMIACTGCVSIPEFDPEDGVHIEADGLRIRGRDLSLHFAAENTYHYPDSLVFGAHELIGTANLPNNCGIEDEIGIALYPAVRISPGPEPPPADGNGGDTDLKGPAVVKVRVDWQSRFTNGTVTRYPKGSSTFTVFPDSKIVRHDELGPGMLDADHVDAGTSIDASTAGCSGTTSPDWYITSFWTFAASQFTSYIDGRSHPPGLPTDEYEMVPDFSCVENQDTVAAGVAWRGHAGSSHRVRPPAPSTVAFVHDFRPHQPTVGVFDPAVFSVDSAVFLGSHACSDFQQASAAYIANAGTRVNGAPVAPEDDGIIGGGPNGQSRGIPVDGTVTIEGPMPASTAIWLRWNTSNGEDNPRVTTSVTRTGTWYIPQREDDTNMIYWFRDGLTAGDTITITPR